MDILGRHLPVRGLVASPVARNPLDVKVRGQGTKVRYIPAWVPARSSASGWKVTHKISRPLTYDFDMFQTEHVIARERLADDISPHGYTHAHTHADNHADTHASTHKRAYPHTGVYTQRLAYVKPIRRQPMHPDTCNSPLLVQQQHRHVAESPARVGRAAHGHVKCSRDVVSIQRVRRDDKVVWGSDNPWSNGHRWKLKGVPPVVRPKHTCTCTHAHKHTCTHARTHAHIHMHTEK